MTTFLLVVALGSTIGLGGWGYGKMKYNEGKQDAQMDTVTDMSNINLDNETETVKDLQDMQKKRFKKELKYKKVFKGRDGKKRAKAAFDLLRSK